MQAWKAGGGSKFVCCESGRGVYGGFCDNGVMYGVVYALRIDGRVYGVHLEDALQASMKKWQSCVVFQCIMTPSTPATKLRGGSRTIRWKL